MARKRSDENGEKEPPKRRARSATSSEGAAAGGAGAKRSSTRRAKAAAAEPGREPTHEEIAQRAYEISQSGEGGSDADNWHRAERELRQEG